MHSHFPRAAGTYRASLLLLLTLWLYPTTVNAQIGQSCSLTREQVRQAAAAFASMELVLKHPRCARCHGTQDVFAKGTAHYGGRFFDEEAIIESEWSDCTECHDAAKKMAGKPEDLQWRQAMSPVLKWGGAPARERCLAMKANVMTSAQFLAHVKNDVRLRLAFEGKRGHIKLPDDVKAQPPPLSHAAFVAAVGRWITALGGEKNWMSKECGCEPVAPDDRPCPNIAGTWTGQLSVKDVKGRTNIKVGQSRLATFGLAQDDCSLVLTFNTNKISGYMNPEEPEPLSGRRSTFLEDPTGRMTRADLKLGHQGELDIDIEQTSPDGAWIKSGGRFTRR